MPKPNTPPADEDNELAALGQVFTPPTIVDCMLTLVRNKGRVLEPACGDGAFLQHFPDALGIEIDPRHAPPGAEVMNFFELAEDELFTTIIGNPPYVRYQDISPGTRRLAGSTLLDKRANLYLFFVEKCLRLLEPGGELIFITTTICTARGQLPTSLIWVTCTCLTMPRPTAPFGASSAATKRVVHATLHWAPRTVPTACKILNGKNDGSSKAADT